MESQRSTPHRTGTGRSQRHCSASRKYPGYHLRRLTSPQFAAIVFWTSIQNTTTPSVIDLFHLSSTLRTNNDLIILLQPSPFPLHPPTSLPLTEMTSLNAPLSYVTPPFPSLYWPIGANPSTPQYLYTLEDIWRFVLTWTLVTVGAAHLLVALWATLCQFLSAYRLSTYLKSPAGQALSAKNRKLLGEKPLRETAGWVWGIFVVYIVMGG